MHPTADSLADFRFSEQTLGDLLEALRARAATIRTTRACRELAWGASTRMAAACTELQRRGYPFESVSVTGWAGEKTRSGWALGASTASVPWHPPMQE